MPRAAELARGGAVRYRTIRRGGKLIRISVVRREGPRGGHTIGRVIRRKA